MLYYAYGSNMSLSRLQRRVPAERLGVGILRGYALRFHKPGETDGSAKCDIVHTGLCSDSVYGVVYSISSEAMEILDRYEGVGTEYTRLEVVVEMNNGQVSAFTYKAMGSDPSLKPYTWYRQHVLEGARENCLPLEYIRMIESVAAMEDADENRHRAEVSIYPVPE
jgi:gamma-glutamylcyclotransferase